MIQFIVALVILLGVITIAQLIRVFELAAQLKGSREENISTADNRMNGTLFLLFLFVLFGFVTYSLVEWGPLLLPESASEHGVAVDNLMNFNLAIIGFVFFGVQLVLFWFAFKYYKKNDGRKAEYFLHSNKLELLWTSVPAVVLAIIIIYGLTTWNNIMGPLSEESINIELYAKQFDWTARYAGNDNKLGKANFRLIEGPNALGLDSNDEYGQDDIIVKGEILIPVNREINFSMRSRDVIHSAFMPHFRAQMNCVPGMVTQFHFTPTITTAEMREKTGNPEFNYILLCNKICGAAHYNMQMDIIVVSEEEYNKWLSEQKPFFASNKAGEEPKAESVVITTDTVAVALNN
ncbi:MAG: cytochrome c oxidase subunit II [Bacteroidia bacterium]